MTGSGTIGDPYIIQNVTDLQNIENDLTAYYELEGNIDASATSGWNGNAGFLPITSFSGQLDGKDFTISDLFINRTGSTNQALFAIVNSGGGGGLGIVKNVIMTGVDITSDSDNAGALIGTLTAGTISDCNVDGAIAITGGADKVGGLVGDVNGGTFNDCSSSCTVSGQDNWVGGFVGQSQGTFNRCFADGNVAVTGGGTLYAGGFVGGHYSGFIMTDCYAIGNVSSDDSWVGGFAGINSANLINCYSVGAVSGSSRVGGFCGAGNVETNCFWDTETSGQATDQGSATGKTTAQMKTEATFTDVGWDFTTVWVMSGYPVLRAFITVVAAGNEGYYWIETTRVHFIDENLVDQSFEGSLVDAASRPIGTVWTETSYLHYIDESGDERRQEGTATGVTGQPPGTIWTEGANLHYIDENGAERYI